MPVEIVPDTKDWTWVLERRCPECGFDTRLVQRDSIPDLLRECGAEWTDVLQGSGDICRRPAETVWSPLEYGCHVRDVFRLFDVRLGLMLAGDDPLFPNWDQDTTAIDDRYWEQDPSTIAADLRAAADMLADRFERVTDGQWQRRGRRSDGARFTIESFGRYLLHDPCHHLFDVTGRGYGENNERMPHRGD